MIYGWSALAHSICYILVCSYNPRIIVFWSSCLCRLVEWRQKELARHSGQYATKWGVMFSAWFHGLMPRARAEVRVSTNNSLDLCCHVVLFHYTIITMYAAVQISRETSDTNHAHMSVCARCVDKAESILFV